MKKILKKSIAPIILLITILFNNKVFAFGDIKGDGDSFISKGSTSSPITVQEAWDNLLPIAQILLAIASVVLVIAYMYLGIQYMITDPQGKADIKQKLIGLVIATVIIYGGIGIFTVIINLFNSIFA